MESEGKADISTLEKTGHLYFAPTKERALKLLSASSGVASGSNWRFDPQRLQKLRAVFSED
jgi:hypothetical protein